MANLPIKVDKAFHDEWLIEGKIGEGTFGEVFLAMHKKDREKKVAVKRMRATRGGEGISPTALREVALLSELSHDNIVRLERMAVNHDDQTLFLLFTYVEYDLQDILSWHYGSGFGQPPAPLPEFTLRSLAWQLLSGLSYLHRRFVIHRDVKPSNVLVTGEAHPSGLQGCVKIADFGLARLVNEPLRPLFENGLVVTIWYRAPELLLGAKHYTRAVDMWAVGCVLGEMIGLKALFKGVEDKSPNGVVQLDQLTTIVACLGQPTPENWKTLPHMPYWEKNICDVRTVVAGVSGPPTGFMDKRGLFSSAPQSALDLLGSMLQYDPERRPSAEEALNHAFFQEAPVSRNALVGPNSERSHPPYMPHYPLRTVARGADAVLGGAMGGGGGGGGAAGGPNAHWAAAQGATGQQPQQPP